MPTQVMLSNGTVEPSSMVGIATMALNEIETNQDCLAIVANFCLGKADPSTIDPSLIKNHAIFSLLDQDGAICKSVRNIASCAIQGEYPNLQIVNPTKIEDNKRLVRLTNQNVVLLTTVQKAFNSLNHLTRTNPIALSDIYQLSKTPEYPIVTTVFGDTKPLLKKLELLQENETISRTIQGIVQCAMPYEGDSVHRSVALNQPIDIVNPIQEFLTQDISPVNRSSSYRFTTITCVALAALVIIFAPNIFE